MKRTWRAGRTWRRPLATTKEPRDEHPGSVKAADAEESALRQAVASLTKAGFEVNLVDRVAVRAVLKPAVV